MPRRSRVVMVAVVPIVVFNCGVRAQNIQPSTDRPSSALSSSAPAPPIRLAGEMELARLVDLAAERSGERVEYNAAEVTGKVTLRVAEELDAEQLWQLTNHVLASRGLAVVKRPAGLSVVKLDAAAALAPVLTIEARSGAPAGTSVPGVPEGVAPGTFPLRGFVTAVIPLRARAAKEGGRDGGGGGSGAGGGSGLTSAAAGREIADAVKPLLSKQGSSVTVLGGGAFLAVSDLAERVEQVRRLVDLLDTPTEPTTIEEVAVQNLAPSALATLVAQVIAKRDAVAGPMGERVPGDVLASPNGEGLLIVAPSRHLPYWRELINKLDRREPVRTVTYVPKRFAPREVASLIERSVLGGPGNFSAPQGNANAGSASSSTEGRAKLVLDDLTGSILLTATPSQHEQVAALIERLESQPEGSARPVRSFPVRNRPVNDLLETLSRLIDAGVLDAASENAGNGSSTNPSADQRTVKPPPAPLGTSAVTSPSSVATYPSTGSSPLVGDSRPGGVRAPRGAVAPLSLTADDATNTLIAVGEPRLLSQVENLVKTLDVRQPQVMLEVTLLSLTESEALSLGVELERIGSLGNATVKLSSLFGLSTGGAAARTVGDAAGFTGAVLNPGEFSVIVRALQTLGNGRSASIPRILVANNKTANFSSTLQQPFRTILNSANSTTTSGFGGSEDAGTTIAVTPNIGQGDHLTLNYKIALSSFVGTSSDPSLPPPKQQNKVDSEATIPDGHIVVVGGLDLTSDSKSTTQVPILGNIPLVGELFMTRNNTLSRSRFYVFIKASVLRSSTFEDLKFVSNRETAKLGISDGLPKVEPRVFK